MKGDASPTGDVGLVLMELFPRQMWEWKRTQHSPTSAHSKPTAHGSTLHASPSLLWFHVCLRWDRKPLTGRSSAEVTFLSPEPV